MQIDDGVLDAALSGTAGICAASGTVRASVDASAARVGIKRIIA